MYFWTKSVRNLRMIFEALRCFKSYLKVKHIVINSRTHELVNLITILTVNNLRSFEKVQCKIVNKLKLTRLESVQTHRHKGRTHNQVEVKIENIYEPL